MLKNKVVLVTGSSRGIGKIMPIGDAAAADGSVDGCSAGHLAPKTQLVLVAVKGVDLWQAAEELSPPIVEGGDADFKRMGQELVVIDSCLDL